MQSLQLPWTCKLRAVYFEYCQLLQQDSQLVALDATVHFCDGVEGILEGITLDEGEHFANNTSVKKG
eukprot:6884979-Ditylum_brightwellii.AAC.1